MIESVRKELFEQIVRIRPSLSPKKRRVADYMMEDYKRLFLTTAKEIAQKCKVSEPTISRFVMDLGFNGYGEFEQYLKGMLRDELTSVERLLKVDPETKATTTLNAYSQNTAMNLENMMNSVSETEIKNLARMIFQAESVMVAGYKASASLAFYLGYLLKKIKEGVLIDTDYSWDNLDYIAVHAKSLLLFVIAFPRYPMRAFEIIEYAKQYQARVICLSDALKSPIINMADHYVVVDMEGFSFIDPFSHIITFLGALVHEIAYTDKDATAERLSRIEDGVRRRNDFFTEEKEELADYDPLNKDYHNDI